MAEASTLRIPKVHHYSEMSGGAFLVMEFIEFGGRSSQEELGRGLAEMHLSPCQDPNAEDGKFGFEVDNTIGGTKQVEASAILMPANICPTAFLAEHACLSVPMPLVFSDVIGETFLAFAPPQPNNPPTILQHSLVQYPVLMLRDCKLGHGCVGMPPVAPTPPPPDPHKFSGMIRGIGGCGTACCAAKRVDGQLDRLLP